MNRDKISSLLLGQIGVTAYGRLVPPTATQIYTKRGVTNLCLIKKSALIGFSL